MIKAINLKTEYLSNPIGIDVSNPRLYWNVSGEKKQSAYKITAKNNDVVVWDSGKVMSSSMTHIPYPKALKSKERIVWNVLLWDENDKEGEWSDSAFFETGLLYDSDWKAKWITGNYNPKKKTRYPIDCFYKQFDANDVAKARLYITACGVYEAKLNGEKVGNFFLAPGYTDYNKRAQYQTYDVTELIKSDTNELSIELADGWYRGSVGAWGLLNEFGTETKVLAQLELTDKNCDVTYINSDETWQWSNDGTIRFADNKDGEIVEAYRTPSYSGKAKVTKHKIVPSASNNVSITEHENFAALQVIKTPSGKTVLNFGQNIAGYVSFKLSAKKGQEICMRFGELIDKSGEFTQKNVQCVKKERVTPLQKVEYTAKDGINEYKTKFAIFGFQYVLIETDIEWKAEDFTATAVYSDMEQTGSFACSNELVNKFFENTVWSAKGNHADVPTDCPTRERHGWTGDAQIFFKTASYLFDYAAFSGKYLTDMYDWQKKNGRLPQIVPYGGVDFYMATMNGSVGWSDAGVIIPYGIFKQYGDKGILEKYYDGMKSYAKFMIKRCGKKTILSKPLHLKHKDRKFAVNYGQSYGEWAEPADVFPNKWTDMILPHPEVSTAYTSYIMELMCAIAKELGKTEDIKLYRKYADGTKQAYQAIRRTKEYPLDTDRQAMLVRPLYFDLLDSSGTEYAKKRLIQALENYDWRLGTGFLSTPLILDVLSDIDTKYAYRLLENEQMPGWLFMPKAGATTVWESWEGTEAQGGIASLNHYSKGAVCSWLFDTMCGIKIADENKFEIEPKIGGNITHAKAEYKSIYGKVSSGWEIKDGKTVYTIEVPCNTTADFMLNGEVTTLNAGKQIIEG